MEYITAEEKELLEAELANRHQADSQITDRIAKARELGDLKENAEYHAAREDKGMNQAKIKMIEEKLATAVVADPADTPDGMVFLGSMVKLRDTDTDDEDLYKLVGESSGRFDMEYLEVTSGSNLGQSLFKAKVGETIRVDLPQGARTFEIVEILD
ncbi:MAG: transcription elongation factor GreA [Planctomycetes bacterium]|nr:transcription elongation factor GreA [Planctomycetota bacterium]MCP4838615.1 transcription elongation factor GreA [Planctomycetota bacterium]